jgi:hypothetical protein
MIGELESQNLDAAYGLPWFEIASGGLGCWSRAVWNAAAIVQMHCYSIPWGGSLAIRVDAMRAAQLPQRWRQALFEDVLVAGALGRDRRIAAAGVFLTNPASCSMGSMWSWLVRQLLDVRLYHRRWPWVVAHACCGALIPWSFVAVGLAAAAGGRVLAAFGAAAGWLLVQAVNLALLAWIENTVRFAIGKGGRLPNGTSGKDYWPRRACKIGFSLVAVSLVQILHAAAVVWAWRVKRITWRGITYEIKGPWEIRRTNYCPARSGSPDPTA